MASRDRGKATATICTRILLTTSPITSDKAGFIAQAISPGRVKRPVLLAILLALFFVTATDRPSGAAELPAVMHSPQGALDVAAALPGRYGLLARKARPGEAAISSVKAVAGLMKQATEVTVLLPKDEPPKNTASAAAAPAAELSAPENVSMRPADAALRVASFVPQAPKKAAAEVKVSGLLSSGSLLWPTDGLIYSAFGASRGKRGHGAIDIVTKKGTPIAAAAAGTVAVAANGGKLFSGYGKIVILDHGEGIHTVYAHCDSLLVKMGQRVKAGEYIGTVGRTGKATTDHCHFEVRVAGKKIDPLKCLPSRPEMVKATNWRSSSVKKNTN